MCKYHRKGFFLLQRFNIETYLDSIDIRLEIEIGPYPLDCYFRVK